MPLLDVTDILFDPDFFRDISVETTTISVNTSGVATASTTTESTTAVVTPLTSRELDRMPEGELLKGGITVFSHYKLDSGGNGTTADIVIVGGVRYTVYSCDDYSAYGEGFNVAICQLISFRGDN